MYKILLTGHGKFCEGLIDVFEMLSGEVGVIDSLPFTRDLDFEDFEKLMEEKIKDNKLIILADIIGGTPMKVALEKLYKLENDSVVIAGINLPLLLDIYFKVGNECNDIKKLKKIMKESIQQSRENINIFDSSFVRGE